MLCLLQFEPVQHSMLQSRRVTLNCSLAAVANSAQAASLSAVKMKELCYYRRHEGWKMLKSI